MVEAENTVPIKTLTIERGGNTIVAVEDKTTKGKQPGRIVYDIDDNVSDEQVITWFGKEVVGGILRKSFRRSSAEYVDEATDDETGKIDEKMLIELFATFDATGDTMDDLREREDGIKAKMIRSVTEGNQADVMKYAQELKVVVAAINKKSKKKKNQEQPAPATT